MSQTIPSCIGNIDNPKQDKKKCQKCEFSEQCKELRLAIRGDIIRKLDSGVRQYLIGHLWSKGDALASGPINDDVRLIMILEAYMDVYGTTDTGLTGLADSELYEKVVEYHSDLVTLLNVLREIIPKCRSDAEFEVYAEPTLIELEDKYSKKNGEKIYGNPTKLLQTIKAMIYKEIYPKLIAQITTVASLETRGFPAMFNPQAIPRFRRPDIDKAPRE